MAADKSMDRKSAYGSIRQINQFLEMQKKYSAFSEEKNLRWEAQARFFRAFLYFPIKGRRSNTL